MHRRASCFVAGAIAALGLFVGPAAPAPAASLTSYRLVDLGPASSSAYIGIDDDGNTGEGVRWPTAPCTFDRIAAPSDPRAYAPDFSGIWATPLKRSSFFHPARRRRV